MKFPSLSFRSLLLLGFLFPSFIALLGCASWLGHINRSITAAETSVEAIGLIQRLDAIAHQHAVERGLTAGFLGSGGQKGRQKVDAQRIKADNAQAQLTQSLAEENYPLLTKPFVDRIASPVRQQLIDKPELRAQVDRLQGSAAFGYYSELNRRALLGIRLSIAKVRNQTLANELDTLLALLWIKERAGQSRGALNGVFAAGSTSEGRHVQIAQFLRDEQQLFDYLTLVANQKTLDEILSLKAKDHWQQVQTISANFISQRDLANIKGPENWFELATQRIGDVKKLSDALSSTIVAQAESEARQLEAQRLTTLAIFGTLSILLAAYLYFQYRQVTRRTSYTKRIMQQAAAEHDYTQRIQDLTKDEVGTISRSFDRFLNEDHRLVKQRTRCVLTQWQAESSNSTQIPKTHYGWHKANSKTPS